MPSVPSVGVKVFTMSSNWPVGGSPDKWLKSSKNPLEGASRQFYPLKAAGPVNFENEALLYVKLFEESSTSRASKGCQLWTVGNTGFVAGVPTAGILSEHLVGSDPVWQRMAEKGKLRLS